MDNAGFGLSRKTTKQIARQVALRLGKTDFRASSRWYDLFMTRNPTLKARVAQNFEQLRAKGVNRDQVDGFFKICEEAIQFCIDNSSYDEMDPDYYLNLDEAGIEADDKRVIVMSTGGKRAVHKVSNCRMVSTRASSVNVIGAGLHIWVPSYLLEGVNDPTDLVLPDGSLSCLGTENKWFMTPKGSMTDEAWEMMVIPDIIAQGNKLRKAKGKGKEKDWMLLIMDGFGSHSYSWKALMMLLDAYIKAIRISSHTSSAVQALDLTCFKPARTQFSDLLEAYSQANFGKLLTKADLLRLWNKSWISVSSSNNLVIFCTVIIKVYMQFMVRKRNSLCIQYYFL
jgi:hypothetical protein